MKSKLKIKISMLILIFYFFWNVKDLKVKGNSFGVVKIQLILARKMFFFIEIEWKSKFKVEKPLLEVI